MTDGPIWIGAGVVGARGEALGRVGAVYADNATGRPAWVSVEGRDHTSVAPLAGSRFDGQVLSIPFDGRQVQTAPHHDPAGLISYEDGDDLARHYGLRPAEPSGPVTPDVGPTDPAPSAAAGSDAADGMVLSQEQLRAGVVNVVVGRARLVTSIVTEDQTFTIPVRRQEVRLVFDPVPPAEQVVTDIAPAQGTHEIVLHAEQVLFTTQVVPVERVRLVTRVVTAGQTVTTQVDSEQIELVQHDAGGDVSAPSAGGPNTV